MKFKKSTLGIVMLFTSAGLAWASCGGTELMVSQAVTKMAASLAESVASLQTDIATQSESDTRQLLGSLKALTAQVKAATDSMTAAQVQATSATAQAMTEIANAELKAKINDDFVESKGAVPCDETQAMIHMTQVEKSIQSGMSLRLGGEIQAIGHYAPQASVQAQRQREHDQLYCSQTEVDVGACSRVGDVPGGDQNASLLFSSDTSPNVVAAKNAFINNVIGMPDEPISRAAAGTPEANAYVMLKKQKDSLLSFSAYSLKSIQADNEQFDPVMNARVGQYFGTAAAEQWAAAQAEQSTRGVLIDLVKMQGLELKLEERRLKQSMRMEANLAALVELEAKEGDAATLRAALLAARAAGTHQGEGNQ